MLKDVRTAAGLGYPPSKFTTNASESLNAVMKRKVDYSETQWSLFNDHMKELVLEQRDEVIRALSGRGKYQLCKPYEHLQVQPQEWVKMTSDQRKRHIKEFDAAAMRGSGSTQNRSENLVSTSPSLSKPSGSSTASHHNANQKYLSVLCEDSGIENVPFATLHSIWVKAEEYLNSPSDIVTAPGGDRKAKMVSSKSSITPHFVRYLSSGQYACDNSCMQWKSSQLCSHVVAVAELNAELDPFLQWYKSSNQQPNITSLAMNNLPAGRGRKGGIPKRKRANQPVVTEVLVKRPGTCKTPLTQVHGPASFTATPLQPQPVVTPPVSQRPVIVPVVQQQPARIPVSQAAISSSQAAISSSNPVLAQVVSCNVGPLITHTVALPATAPIVPNLNPFFIRIIEGNIRVCQGCRTDVFA